MQLCGGSSGLAPEGRTDILTAVALQLRSPVGHSADQSYLWMVSVESISRTWGMEASTEVRSALASRYLTVPPLMLAHAWARQPDACSQRMLLPPGHGLTCLITA